MLVSVVGAFSKYCEYDVTMVNTHHLRHNVPDKCSGREELQRAKPGEAAPCARQIYTQIPPLASSESYSKWRIKHLTAALNNS